MYRYALPSLSPSDVLVLTTWCCRDDDAFRSGGLSRRGAGARTYLSTLPRSTLDARTRVRRCPHPRPGCGAHAHHNFLARGVLSTIQPPPPPRVLPPPPSYGAASHVVLPLAHCPVFTTSRFRSRSLRISPLAFAAARAGRSSLPTAMSLRCPLLSPAIACPRLGLRTLHLISRCDATSRRDRGRP